MRIFCLILGAVVWMQPVWGQPPGPPQLADASNFFSVQQAMNEYFKRYPTAKGFKQWKRKEWFLEPRLYPHGDRENLTMKTLDAYLDLKKQQAEDGERATHGAWTFIGPNSCSHGLGRLNAIALNPANPSIFYVGSANGGVWKTTNGGSSWSNVSPDLPLLAVADIKLSPSNPDVLYLLTGDGDPDPSEGNAHLQDEVSSIGILRSADGGATWQPTNFSFEHPSVVVPTKLLIHPSDVDVQFVVGNHGIYRTDDHWATWDLVRSQPTFDIEFKPGNPNIMFASGDNEIVKSVNNGVTWSFIFDSDFSIMSDATRVELAVAPNNADVIYALAGNWDDGLLAFYQSESEGDNNTWTTQNQSTNVMGNFAHYCIGLVVDPNDHTDVFGGFQHISKSSNAGLTWLNIEGGDVHVDIHDVAYMHGALWVCSDGGLYKSIDEGFSWTELVSGLAITEIYRIAGTPQSNNLIFLGCQDNGTMKKSGTSTTFEHVNGGDGTSCQIDYANSNIVYASSQYGSFAKSISGGGSGSFVDLEAPGGEGPWISPLIIDPVDHNRIFIGNSSVYRSNDQGETWTYLDPPIFNDEINCLAQGTSNFHRLYVSAGPNLYRTDNALENGAADWSFISSELPDLFITGIAVDPNHSNRVFITYSGYADGIKVYRSTNEGNSWTNISGNLPNVPVNCIEFYDNGLDNDALYIGTDIGVFYRDDALSIWIYYSNSMPAVNVSDLYINYGFNTIVAGTFGRGLWRSPLYDGCADDISLTHSFGLPIGGVRYYSALDAITSNAIYKKELGTEIHYKAANAITLTTDFSAGSKGFFHGYIGACPGGTDLPFIAPENPMGKLILAEEHLNRIRITN